MAGSISGIDWVSRMPVSGTHTVSSTEAGASSATIDTGKTDAVGFILQVYRADVHTPGPDVDMVAGVLTIVNVSQGYTLTAGDVINWIVF